MPIYTIALPNGSTNTIIATADAVEAVYPGVWQYVGEEPAPAQVAPQPRHITVGAFLLRFGQKMVPILSSADPVVQALCILVRAMTYIDLDDPRLTQQLPYLVQAKLLTLDELQEVLQAEIQPEERP